jgi:hypothetical protein
VSVQGALGCLRGLVDKINKDVIILWMKGIPQSAYKSPQRTISR